MRLLAGAAHAGRRVIDLAVIGLHVCDEFRQRFCRHAGIDHQHVRHERHAGDRGEVLLEVNHELTEKKIDELRGRGVKEVKVIYTDNLTYGAFVRETLVQDKVFSPEEALIEIYKRMRPGDPPTIEAARQLRGTSTAQVDGAANCLVVSGPSAPPSSALVLSRD